MKRIFWSFVTAGALVLAGILARPAEAHGPRYCGPGVGIYSGYGGYGGYGGYAYGGYGVPIRSYYTPGYVPYGAGYIGGYQPYQNMLTPRPRVGIYFGF